MLSIFDSIRDVSLLSVTVRMILAVICGGCVGIEREFKRRPAGFRTHILICLGATMTTLTSQYLLLTMHYYTDIARLGAQVVAGIGFIGAGTIIVTRNQRVKGLTTAAGLWASAIVGLALGAGFYEGGLLTTVLILLAELVFSKVELSLLQASPEINVYIEYADKSALEHLLTFYRERKVKILSLEITRSSGSEKHNACAIFSLRLHRQITPEQVLAASSAVEGVFLVEEL